jgi:hypothetical protein
MVGPIGGIGAAPVPQSGECAPAEYELHIECPRCHKPVGRNDLQLLTEKDTHGYYPSNIHVCKECHREVKQECDLKLKMGQQYVEETPNV